MEKLTECSELTAEHLDLMWAVTEKVKGAVESGSSCNLLGPSCTIDADGLRMISRLLLGSSKHALQFTARLLQKVG